MKNNKFILVLLFFLQACSQQETLSQEEVRQAINRFDQGWQFKNPNVVDSVLSSSYVYFTQSGGTFSRENVLKTAGSEDYKLDSMNRTHYEIRIEGNTAIVNTTWFGRGKYYGKSFKDKQRCSITLVKKKRKVEILSEHCTPMR